jgi:hypothetical protein
VDDVVTEQWPPPLWPPVTPDADLRAFVETLGGEMYPDDYGFLSDFWYRMAVAGVVLVGIGIAVLLAVAVANTAG